ncbi:MAG: phage holin family protein, partial [Candidatus Eremiobacteraeota bacterium]|nr:phage holin family protein [Candidatus Eremiobacteraeota bacterium]
MATESESTLGTVKQLGADVATLVREELRVARAEMTEKVQTAGAGAGMLSGSAVAGLFTLTCLTGL